MLQELPVSAYPQARALFEPFDYSLSIRALLEGRSPGHIFVDDPARPELALALTVEGYLLGGEPSHPGAVAAVRDFLRDQVFSRRLTVNVDDWMCLAVHPAEWETHLPELVPTHPAEKVLRYHYLCREVTSDWREQLPESYSLRPMDRGILDQLGVSILPDVTEFLSLEATWGTRDDFLAHGLGRCIVQQGQVVAWCFTVCATPDQAELAIVTAPAHRRRGLAAALAAATAEAALQQGCGTVSWHCDYDTIGSWKTAEKVGFHKSREYIYYYYIYELAEQLAQLGWRHFTLHDYARSTACFQEAFAMKAESTPFNYHFAAAAWAAQGDTERAISCLTTAVERGWKSAERTLRTEEFRSLHGTPEWEALLSQMVSHA